MRRGGALWESDLFLPDLDMFSSVQARKQDLALSSTGYIGMRSRCTTARPSAILPEQVGASIESYGVRARRTQYGVCPIAQLRPNTAGPSPVPSRTRERYPLRGGPCVISRLENSHAPTRTTAVPRQATARRGRFPIC